MACPRCPHLRGIGTGVGFEKDVVHKIFKSLYRKTFERVSFTLVSTDRMLASADESRIEARNRTLVSRCYMTVPMRPCWTCDLVRSSSTRTRQLTIATTADRKLTAAGAAKSLGIKVSRYLGIRSSRHSPLSPAYGHLSTQWLIWERSITTQLTVLMVNRK
jgi:hypothetical protein